MTPDDVARDSIERMDRFGIPYVLVGSYSSNIWGRVRSTHDVDIVADMTEDQADALARSYGGDYYADPEAAKEAARKRDQFNVIHIPSGTKADFWILREDEYARASFDRRRPTALWGRTVAVQSPEDTILSKLIRYRIGGGVSGQQWTDICDVWDIQSRTLDRAYLDLWASKLGVADLLARAIAECSMHEPPPRA